MMRNLLPLCGVAICTMLGCASHHSTSATQQTPTTKPASASPNNPAILYHRTGGIAGTDDRVVIWPDGLVQVRGRILPNAEGHLSPAAVRRLQAMFDGWNQLKNDYPDAGVEDAYTITISRGGKTVEASDLAPNLPDRFRKIFTEIEAIAAQAGSSAPPPAP